MRFDLSDEEWAANERLLPAAKHGPARVDDRRVSCELRIVVKLCKK